MRDLLFAGVSLRLRWGLAALLVAVTAGCAAASEPTPARTPTPTAIVASAVEAPPVPEAPTPPALPDRGPAASAEVYGTPFPSAAAELPTPPATAPTSDPEPSLRLPPTPIVTALPAPALPNGARQRTVVLDPGHGGPEVGAASGSFGEKTANLHIALRLQRLLEEDGLRVVLTRDSDRRAFVLPPDQAENPRSMTRADLQARVDIANAARADLFLSIHNNGSGDPAQSGTEVWYDPSRPFGHLNQALAEEVLAALIAELRAAGYPVVNRGLKDASHFRVFQGRVFPIFVLGAPRASPTPTRATTMPGILGETLFLSHPVEAQLLQREDIQEAIAYGYRNGLLRYFQRMDAGELQPPFP